MAFQAVMADLLGGDTIHHALNIGIFGKSNSNRREGVCGEPSVRHHESVITIALADY